VLLWDLAYGYYGPWAYLNHSCLNRTFLMDYPMTHSAITFALALR
jgi:hypothetical protein